MTRTTPIRITAVAIALTALACSSSSTKGKASPTTAYRPAFKAADFSANVDNPWFPLQPGSVAVFTGTKDGKAARNVVTVTDRTKVVDGVATRVVNDKLYLDGKLEEKTLDYYTQHKNGDVWYFGEDTATLDENGKVTSTDGTWHAGVDGAIPGVFMEADPKVGHTFRQEYLKGQAEDHFQVLDLSTSVTVPYGTFHDAVLTKEWTPLEPEVLDHKFYVRGIGQVREASVTGPKEVTNLVSFTK